MAYCAGTKKRISANTPAPTATLTHQGERSSTAKREFSLNQNDFFIARHYDGARHGNLGQARIPSTAT
jgi:hypothetical protein